MISAYTGKLKSWGGISLLAGAAMGTCFFMLTQAPDLRGANVIHFLAYFMLAAAAYVLAILRLERDRLPLTTLWFFALLFRALLLFTAPTLSDDVYRYLWDGHLINQGANPYTYPVNAPELDVYSTSMRESVNHNWMASPYLPVTQVYFALVNRLAPQSLLAFQLGAVILDLVAGWLVMDTLAALALPRRRALLYLWNPLVIVEFAHGAHVDALMLCLVMLAFWLLARSNHHPAYKGILKTASVFALAAATLVKGLPILLASLLLRRWGWRRLVLYALLVFLPIAGFAASAGWGLSGSLDGTGVFGALRIYTQMWNYNSGLYHWLEVALTGYPSPGAVPLEPAYESAIRLAKLITTGIMGLVMLAITAWAWRRDRPDTGAPLKRTRFLLRLAVIPVGAYLLLTTTIHPWYVTLIVPFLPFLLPREAETKLTGRLVWPWVYFSIAVAFSYITYIDPGQFREFYLVRQVEYIPLFGLLVWAVLSLLKKPSAP
jgi:hypothetical protein